MDILIGGVELFVQFWYFCEIISNLDQWLRKRLKIFLILSSGGQFIQRRTICAILIKGKIKNILVNLFTRIIIGAVVYRYFFYLQLWWPFCLVVQIYLHTFSNVVL